MSVGSVNVPWHLLKKRLATEPKPLSPFLEGMERFSQMGNWPTCNHTPRRLEKGLWKPGSGRTRCNLKDPMAKSRGKSGLTDNASRKLPGGYAGRERLYFWISQEKKRKNHLLVLYSQSCQPLPSVKSSQGCYREREPWESSGCGVFGVLRLHTALPQ